MYITDNLKLAEECFQDAMIADDLRPASIKKYAGSIKKFFTVICDKKIENLTNSDFDRFIIHMKKDGASNSRIANIIASAKWVITKMQSRDILFAQLNLLTIRKPRVMKTETNYLTEEEVEQFLECIKIDIAKKETVKNIRFMALVVLLMQTGARIGEALSIDIDDINRQNKEVKIIGKGGKQRKLYLRDETLRVLDNYLAIRADKQNALFVTQDGRSRWQQTDVGRSFRRFKKLSGIKKPFVIHTLRHTFATQYLAKGAGINVVQTALGHSDPVTTLKYYAAAVEGVKVKEMINDTHFDFIPDSICKRSTKETSSI
jgi:site-specific recombinase XerD